MGKTVIKDTFREIKGSFGRFFAIFAIVAIGVSFFAGITASSSDMRYSSDSYYDEYNLFDLRLLSDAGFTDDDIKAIRETDGVKGSLRAKLGAEPRGQTVQLAGGAQHKAVLQAGRGAFAQDGGRSAGSQVDLGQLGGVLHQRLQRKLRPGQDHAAHQLLLLVDRHHGDGCVG